MPIDFATLEALIRQDPRRRGVASYRREGQWLAAGMLERAARDLAQSEGAVAIVTGFCVADVDPPVAETDGPPGALYLARALSALGREVALVSDGSALGLLEIGCRLWQLNVEVVELPLAGRGETKLDEWLASSLGKRLTHLIAIERVGPSHTLASLQGQPGNSPRAVERFVSEVPGQHRDACHNMRGVTIDRFTAPAHRLFEAARVGDRTITTLGIGDGGNEIGMGAIPWEVLRAALPDENAGRIICRVATDFLILAGVSNWGAYALACAIAGLRGRSDLIAEWDEVHEQELIDLLVREGGAVDGLTRQRTATVDGLPLDFYLGVLKQIRLMTAG
jgi:hypothetical protein